MATSVSRQDVSSRHPGRAVILLLAMAGNFLIWKGTAAPATPVTTNSRPSSSDEESDLPLAPPEDEDFDTGGAPRLVEPDEVTDLPVLNAIGEPGLAEPQGPRDKPPKHRASHQESEAVHHRALTTANASSSSTSSYHPSATSPVLHQPTGQSQLHDPAGAGLHDPALQDRWTPPLPQNQHGQGQGPMSLQVPGGLHQLQASADMPPQQTLPGVNQQLQPTPSLVNNNQQYFEPWSAWDDDLDTGDSATQITHHQAATASQQQPYLQTSLQVPNAAAYVTPSPATRIGFATTYDPDSDPWHDSGQLDDAELGRGPPPDGSAQPQRLHPPPGAQLRPRPQQQAHGPANYPPVKQPPPRPQQPRDPPVRDGGGQQPVRTQQPSSSTEEEWSSLARTLANNGPLLPPKQWAHTMPPTSDDPMAMGNLPQPSSMPAEADSQSPTAQQAPQAELQEAMQEELPPHDPQPHQEQAGGDAQPLSPSTSVSTPPTSFQQPASNQGDHQGEDQPPHPLRLQLQPQPDHEAEEQHQAQSCDSQAQSQAEQLPQEALPEGQHPQDQPENSAARHAHSDPDGHEDEEWITIPNEAGNLSPEETAEDDMDWVSDVSDTEEEEEDSGSTPQDRQERHVPQQAGGNPQKRAAGHGSQRVKNKARKSDVKKLWSQAGWGQKPEWLTWRAALSWLQRGEKPPDKQPRSSAEARAIAGSTPVRARQPRQDHPQHCILLVVVVFGEGPATEPEGSGNPCSNLELGNYSCTTRPTSTRRQARDDRDRARGQPRYQQSSQPSPTRPSTADCDESLPASVAAPPTAAAAAATATSTQNTAVGAYEATACTTWPARAITTTDTTTRRRKTSYFQPPARPPRTPSSSSPATEGIAQTQRQHLLTVEVRWYKPPPH